MYVWIVWISLFVVAKNTANLDLVHHRLSCVVDKPGKRERTWCAGKTFHHPGGLKGRKMKPKVIYYHENLDDSNRCFVRLYKLYMSLCPADCAVDLMPLQTPSAGIPASQTFSPRSLLQHDYDWGIDKQLVMRLLDTVDTAVEKIFVLTQGHLKTSIKQCRTCSAKKTCIQHSIPPKNLNPLKLFQFRGGLVLLNSQTSHLQPSQHHLLSIHVHLSSSILTPIPIHVRMNCRLLVVLVS